MVNVSLGTAAWTPELILIAAALAVFVVDFTMPTKKWLVRLVALLGPALALAAVPFFDAYARAFQGAILIDGWSNFARLALLGGCIAVVLASWSFFKESDYQAEYYGLTIFSVVGALAAAEARNLITLYLAIELMALPVYALVAFEKRDKKAVEAGLKYFLLGLFSSIMMLYGMAIVYATTGSTNFGPGTAQAGPSVLVQAFATSHPAGYLALAGLLFLMAGLGFKLMIFPFHFWGPDVYEGATPPVVAYISWLPKVAVFIALARLLGPDFAQAYVTGGRLLVSIAVLSMFFGNLVALAQRDVKRMLAYSGIAHSGYLFIAFVVGGGPAQASMLYYLAVYGPASLGALFVVTAAAGRRSALLETLDGLGRRMPFMAFCMVAFLMSLAGIPPMAGFFGKFYLFGAAVAQGFTYLALVGLLNSVISLGYYLKIAERMYLYEPPADGVPVEAAASPSLTVAVSAMLALTLLVGLVASPRWF